MFHCKEGLFSGPIASKQLLVGEEKRSKVGLLARLWSGPCRVHHDSFQAPSKQHCLGVGMQTLQKTSEPFSFVFSLHF